MLCERRISSGKRNLPLKEGASSFSSIYTYALAVKAPSKFWKRSALAVSCCGSPKQRTLPDAPRTLSVSLSVLHSKAVPNAGASQLYWVPWIMH
ncbi:hypothetical protein N7449_011745 [Penicillium cf. viridicatum]|uniref:Uncharacterized protein n=1 Tax=Penicillium cf. viridicatum TaxID=2972119 RepID=A0A9W9LXI8_9EURO|nr:hypothetical protein N7449_011745 [Penicillium cf. viridicatum]